MKIAALYARVSGEQQRDSNTIASQTEALIAYAERHGYRVAPDMIIEDNGYSGAVLERPGLERVRDLATEGRIDTVLVHALSANMPETPAPRGISVGRGGENR